MRILRHAGYITCCFCKKHYHLKCNSIVPSEISYMRANSSEWLCETCLSENFPFNHIEDQAEFLDTLFSLNYSRTDLCYLSDKIFNPIDINENFNEMLNDVDPDVNYYNGFQQSIDKCKYYIEDIFNDEVGKNSSGDYFSMMHLNIRSAKKNLGNLEAYLNLLDHKFRIIALTESWITDSDSHLYNLPCYELYENHRSHRRGGGVALYIDVKFECKPRVDLDFSMSLVNLFL